MDRGDPSLPPPSPARSWGQDLTRHRLQPLEEALEVCTWQCAVLSCGQKLGGQSHILGERTHTHCGAGSLPSLDASSSQ